MQGPLVPVAGRDRNRRLGLEEGVFDALRPERLVHRVGAGGVGLLEVGAALVGARRQHVGVGAPHRQWRAGRERSTRIGVRGVDVVGDLDQFRRGTGVVAVSATTTARTSPAYDVVPPTGIITGQSLWMIPTRISPGRSSAVKTASTPGAASAAATSMATMSARAWSVRCSAAWQHAGHADVVDVAAVAECERCGLVLGAGSPTSEASAGSHTTPWATASIASRILTYPVQRHRCAPRCGAMPSRVSDEPFLSICAFARMTMPGMQNPHCSPPHAANAFGERVPLGLVDPFERDDRGALDLGHVALAGHDRLAVDEHGAAPALTRR